jgi:hypothetical protein
MKHFTLISALFLLLFAVVASAQQKEHATPEELKTELPVLAEFHEVIYPLWHQAWPNKDVALIKELLPRVENFTGQIEKTELPGILRDRQAKWKEGVMALRTSTDNLRKAVQAGNQQSMLDAVEQLHSNYEKLVRIVRPRFPEMEAYHTVLYQVYHYDMPNKDVKKLRADAVQLADRANAMIKAPVPKRFAEREKEYRQVLAKIHATSLGLVKVSKGKNITAMESGVEAVHNAYLELEKMYE